MKHLPRLILCSGILLSAFCTRPQFPVVLPASQRAPAQVSRDSSEEYYLLALDNERHGRYREALILFRMAYELDTSSHFLRDRLIAEYSARELNGEALKVLRGGRKLSRLEPADKRIAAALLEKMDSVAVAAKVVESIKDKERSDYLQLGEIYERLGDADRSLRCYGEFFRLSDYAEPLGLKIAQMDIALHRLDAADSILTVLKAHTGEKPEICNMQGVVAIGRRDTARAIERFNRAFGLDSSFEDGARNAAQLYLEKGDFQKAAEKYDYLFGHSVVARELYGRSLAMVYDFQHRFAEASAIFGSITEKFENDPVFHFYYANTLLALDKADSARIEYRKAVSLKPDFSDAWERLYGVAVLQKNYDSALTAARQYAAKNPGLVAAWRCEGAALLLRKEYVPASNSFRKAIALDTANVSSWYDLGCSLERGGDIPGAAAAFRRVLSLKPGDPSTCNYLGYMWADHGLHLDSAKVLLETALAKDPDNGAYLDSYGWVLFRLGNMVKAREYIDRALVLVHNDPEVFEHLGDILAKGKEFAGAEKAYARSLEYGPDAPDRIREKIIRMEIILQRRNSR